VYLPSIQPEPDLRAADKISLPRGQERILVVDDEAMLVDIAQQMLVRLG
jgi:hypothetical protein